MEAANKLEAAATALLLPPSPVQHLLHLLHEFEKCLIEMPQSLPYCVKHAINLAVTVVTSNQLVRSEVEDVRVSVALCVTELMRITAPDPPFTDEQMQVLFPLIVLAFDGISDCSSSSYPRRVGILENFAKVRLWNLLLDLESDSLVLRMFEHFLANIRENHPDPVFMHMGIIMMKTLEESDEIPLEIISTLLARVRTKTENVLPVARKLAERVMENSYSRLTPCIHQAVQYAGHPVEEYGRIVAYLFELQPLPRSYKPLNVVASTQNRLHQDLEFKSDSTMLSWTGMKKRGSRKISKQYLKKELSGKVAKSAVIIR